MKLRKWHIVATCLLLLLVASCTKREVEPPVHVPIEYDKIPETGLPAVFIWTKNQEKIDPECREWYDSAMIAIVSADRKVLYQGYTKIRCRGNSSRAFPKSCYAVKLFEKAEILGMPKNKRWCLLSDWFDRTLIRHAVAFEIARKCPGLEWTPSGRYVELILNGKLVNNYYLCEQIRVGKNRVNITEMEPGVSAGDALTGGYLLEYDTWEDDDQYIMTKKGFKVKFKDPDNVNDAQREYVEDYIFGIERLLYGQNKGSYESLEEYIDIESFIDYWFVQELTMNGEIGHPKSTYVYKDRNGVLKAGPVWDFDYQTYVIFKAGSWQAKDKFYYNKLFTYEEFRARVKAKWNMQKAEFDKIPEYIDRLSEENRASDVLNHARWPMTWSDVNGDATYTYDEAIESMKESYRQKVLFMDENINSW